MSEWRPDSSVLLTRWAADVDPQCPLPEYPRPQLTRPEWLNLNGLWQYAIRPRTMEKDSLSDYDGKILVPYPVESALSGVAKALKPDQRIWYQRTFELPAHWQGKKIQLHFGAVDWETNVWCNGVWVGSHQGGYDPFTFILEDCIHRQGVNELIIAVWDATNAGRQERGKQTLKPGFVFYSAVSGIWQTVWLEALPQTYIESIDWHALPELDGICLKADLGGYKPGLDLRVFVRDHTEIVAQVKFGAQESVCIRIANPRLWSPSDPHLYQLEVRLEEDEKVIDQVGSYCALRSISLKPDANGVPRLMLNGEPVFQYGALDQGYWPDGLYTAPTEEALLYDIVFAKELGLNMLRKHIKVEPARWYYHCDRLGMLVWQDMPNGGKVPGWILLGWGALLNQTVKDTRAYRRFGREDENVRANYRRELSNMMEALDHFACIVVWVPFNEAWGQFDARAVGDWVQGKDPTRLVDAVSGWFDQGSGHIHSIHKYVGPAMPRHETRRALALSEFGGIGLRVDGHLWQQDKLFAYKKVESRTELTAWYLRLMHELEEMKSVGLSAAIYTELTDVEYEINGYLTYDRAICKMDVEELRKAHKRLTDL